MGFVTSISTADTAVTANSHFGGISADMLGTAIRLLNHSVVNCTADTPMTAISATTQIATGSTNSRPLSQSLISCPRCPLTNLRSFSAQACRVPLWNITPKSGNSSISIISIT